MTKFRLDQHVVTTKGVIIANLHRRMKLYLLSVYQPDGDPPPPDVLAKVMAEIESDEIASCARRTAGCSAAGLHPPENSDGRARQKMMKTLMTDGPFVEGKEHLGGFTIIKAADLDVAPRVGTGGSPRQTTLPIEVRPFQGEVDG